MTAYSQFHNLRFRFEKLPARAKARTIHLLLINLERMCEAANRPTKEQLRYSFAMALAHGEAGL